MLTSFFWCLFLIVAALSKMSCWNHPLEVCRIELQSRANAGQSKMSMVGVLRMVVAEHGPAGLFKGVVPRVMLGIWQAVFMVSLPHVIGAPAAKH
jgi:Mitochondrial carrier protein